MSRDGDQFFGLVIQLHLLIGKCEVQLTEAHSACEACHDITWSWEWVLVDNKVGIYGDRHHWCGPDGMCDFPKHSLALKTAVKLLSHQVSNCIWHLTESAYYRLGIFSEGEVCLDMLHSTGRTLGKHLRICP